MDGYRKFFDSFHISKDELFKWGLENTIYPEMEKIDLAWKDLLFRIENNQKVYIRGYGRNAHGTSMYRGLYKYIFENENVTEDPTNNTAPKRIIENLTGLKRNKNIFNYQTAHIFGKTKNIFMFEAPWNIVYIPKIMDPFTGHESKGEYTVEFKEMFVNQAKNRYKTYITEYNSLLKKYDVENKISSYTELLKRENDMNIVQQFEKNCREEFEIIEI